MNSRFEDSCYDGGRKSSYVAFARRGNRNYSLILFNFGINKTTALVY